MTKYIIVLLIFANIALAETTTIFAPNGTVTVCTTGQGMVICV